MESGRKSNPRRILNQLHTMLEVLFNQVGRDDESRLLLSRCHQLARNDSRSEVDLSTLFSDTQSYLDRLHHSTIDFKSEVSRVINRLPQYTESFMLTPEEEKKPPLRVLERARKRRERSASEDFVKIKSKPLSAPSPISRPRNTREFSFSNETDSVQFKSADIGTSPMSTFNGRNQRSYSEDFHSSQSKSEESPNPLSKK